MKVLVAESDVRPNGFSWTLLGEMVTTGNFICGRAGCGCDRSFVGLVSGKGTTSARVAETDMSREQFHQLVRERNDGYTEASIQQMVDETLKMAADMPVGYVYET